MVAMLVLIRCKLTFPSQHARSVRTVSGRARLGRDHKSFFADLGHPRSEQHGAHACLGERTGVQGILLVFGLTCNGKALPESELEFPSYPHYPHRHQPTVGS